MFGGFYLINVYETEKPDVAKSTVTLPMPRQHDFGSMHAGEMI